MTQLHFPGLHLASPSLHVRDPPQVHNPEVHVPKQTGPPPHLQLPLTHVSLLPEQMIPKQGFVSGKYLGCIFSEIFKKKAFQVFQS